MILLAPSLLVLGLTQLLSAHKRLWGLSLAATHHRAGNLAGVALVAAGVLSMPPTPWVLITTLPASAMALIIQVSLGSAAGRGLKADRFLHSGDWPEGRCESAVSRKVMGTAVIGGMLTATCIAIFIIPATFYLMEKLVHREKKGEPEKKEGVSHE